MMIQKESVNIQQHILKNAKRRNGTLELTEPVTLFSRHSHFQISKGPNFHTTHHTTLNVCLWKKMAEIEKYGPDSREESIIVN
jgi:hypothetical protein